MNQMMSMNVLQKKKWMCKECNSRICGEMNSAVFNGKYSRHCTLKVTLSKYDMANELVRTSLSGVYTESDGICKKCHYKLR